MNIVSNIQHPRHLQMANNENCGSDIMCENVFLGCSQMILKAYHKNLIWTWISSFGSIHKSKSSLMSIPKYDTRHTYHLIFLGNFPINLKKWVLMRSAWGKCLYVSSYLYVLWLRPCTYSLWSKLIWCRKVWKIHSCL